MGVPALQAQGSLRLSIGRESTLEEVDQTVDVLKETVRRLRSMSPFYADLKVKRR
jgi:cysteine desulfurase